MNGVRQGWASVQELGACTVTVVLTGLLLLPLVIDGRKTTAIAADVNNQRTVLAASLMYAQEWDQRFPFSLGWEQHRCQDWGGPGPSWFEVVRAYTGSDRFFVSPADPRMASDGFRLASYAPNYLVMGWAHVNQDRLSPIWDQGRTADGLNAIDEPGRFVLLQPNYEDPRSWPCFQSIEVPNNASWFSRRNDFFGGAANFGRADGGVSWVQLPKGPYSLRKHAGLSHYPSGDVAKYMSDLRDTNNKLAITSEAARRGR